MKREARTVTRAAAAVGLLAQLGCGGMKGPGDTEGPGGTGEPETIEVGWGERTCQASYAEGPYPVQDIIFSEGKVNVPLPPVFGGSNDIPTGPQKNPPPRLGWMRAELPLDGTPHNGNENATQCGVVMNMTVRVSSTAPLTVERTVTWTGTRTEPCQSEGVFTPPPSGCRVVQWISYPVDAPAGAAP